FASRLAPLAQGTRLRVGKKKALVFAQRLVDFAIARQCLIIADAEPVRGFAFGVAKVVDAMFADQAGGFVCDQVAVALQSILRMNAVVFASGHDRLPFILHTSSVAESLVVGRSASRARSPRGPMKHLRYCARDVLLQQKSRPTIFGKASPVQKMSKAFCCSSRAFCALASLRNRATSSTLKISFIALGSSGPAGRPVDRSMRTVAMPGGIGSMADGVSLSAAPMKFIQIGSAALAPNSP